MKAVDLVQSRYGWTDQEILSIPYARLLQHFELAHEGHQEALKEKYRQVAFHVWLENADKDSPNFNEYLAGLGLSDDIMAQSTSKRDMDVTKEEALKKAEEVMRMFQTGYEVTHEVPDTKQTIH